MSILALPISTAFFKQAGGQILSFSWTAQGFDWIGRDGDDTNELSLSVLVW